MGFNYYGLGNLNPVGIKDGFVYCRLPSGHEIKYPTKLDFDIPEQVNLFYSETIAFILYHEDKMYIGRFDSSISIYRLSDELLVGLNTWEAPKYVETVHCGFYRLKGKSYEIHLDLRDRKTVYVLGLGIQGCSSKELEKEFNIDESNLASNIDVNNTYHICSERGEWVEINNWTVQKDVRRRNCPIYL